MGEKIDDPYLKGRGAQFNTTNRFLKNHHIKEHIEAIDDWTEANVETQYFEDNAKGLVNKVDSPDVGMWYSMTPKWVCEPANKVWHMIEAGHDGKVNDSVFGRRMRGEGEIAEMISQQYHKYMRKYKLDDERHGLDTSLFQRPGQQGKLF